MIDRILSKFFEFIDNQIQKIEDVLTFGISETNFFIPTEVY